MRGQILKIDSNTINCRRNITRKQNNSSLRITINLVKCSPNKQMESTKQYSTDGRQLVHISDVLGQGTLKEYIKQWIVTPGKE
jgi:hypothetical protein